MYLTRVMLSVAWVSLLSGCMAMGGLGHVGSMEAHSGDEEGGPVPAQLQQAEGSNGDLTIALSFPRPSSGIAVAIEADLRTGEVSHELTDVAISLRIQDPDGSIEELLMQPISPSAAGTHRARYAFPSAGVYLLTAEGQVGTGVGARAVSVTTTAEVRSGAHGVRDNWHAPASLLGSLGVVAMMAFMMGGSGS